MCLPFGSERSDCRAEGCEELPYLALVEYGGRGEAEHPRGIERVAGDDTALHQLQGQLAHRARVGELEADEQAATPDLDQVGRLQPPADRPDALQELGADAFRAPHDVLVVDGRDGR